MGSNGFPPFAVEEHALRKRTPQRTRRTSSLSLGRTLLVVAFVPALALVALWAVTSGQVFLDFQRQAGQGLLAEKAGQPSNLVYYNLQEERRLSAEVLHGHPGAAAALKEQRARTDEAVRQFQTLSDVSEDGAPEEVLDAVAGARAAIARLDAQRSLVDSGDEDQQQAVYDYYTELIAVDLDLFAALSHVDNGRITTLSQPLVDLFRVKEMISRSDALLSRGWGDRTLTAREFAEFRRLVSAQPLVYDSLVVPYLPPDERAQWDAIVDSPQWRTKTAIENAILAPGRTGPGGTVALTADETAWSSAVDGVEDRIETLLELRTGKVVEEGKGSVMALLRSMVLTTLVGLLAIAAVITVTWRLTRTLRRRIELLREQAEALEHSLPDIVERLGKGERIDVEAEVLRVQQDEHDRADDELTRLGEAFNLARASAVEAAIRQADQHRGFERLLQRIARRTQQLIGQQLKKLNDLEHRHEDPELLEDLFGLDHLTARLRRYEENLVILAGGSPQRRWRRPVALLDIMRSAQGEVQDYRRVMLDLDGSPWIAPRAVGPVTHVLAELIENALTFSGPPHPVEVRATRVGRGLAIEVEDRGLGMEEDRLAELNELMAHPPRMDLLAHTEDIRLGLHVVSRLAAQHGLRVEFRSSVYGGTRAVVLVPNELVAEAGETGEPGVMGGVGKAGDGTSFPAPAPQGQAPAPAPVVTPLPRQAAPAGPAGPAEGALPMRGRGRAMAEVTGQHRLPEEPFAYGSGERAASYGTESPASYGTESPAPYGTESPAPYGSGEGVASYGTESPAPYGSGEGVAPYGTESPASYGSGEGVAPYGTESPDPYEHRSPAPYEEHSPRPYPYETAPEPTPSAGTGLGSDQPLPRRVRQASLVDELRVDPEASGAQTAPPPPDWRTEPLLRPVPRRAGATIGAFQRRSREARAQTRTPAPAPAAAPAQTPPPSPPHPSSPSTREDWS
ncbi:nitrate- and nitrite sensing domain-containing protein [Streptomyces sp. NPDC014779]|uniref:sensor histidine kinase n=1 Tax=Streptomyces sp. NPDC014779 TaxID=3364911 RepID=UPI003700BC51